MSAVHCPECGRTANVEPGTATLCAACGARFVAERSVPTVRAVDEFDVPEVRPIRRRPPNDEDEGDSPVPCPKCGSRWIASGSWPWYLGTVGAIICKAVVCEDCGHEFDQYKPKADLAKRKLRLTLAINGIGLAGIVFVFAGLWLWIRFTMNP